MVRAIVLYSGGLDSRLAVKVLQAQGIEVVPVLFKLPFSCVDNALPFDTKPEIIDCTKGDLYIKYLNLIKNPKHGYGSAMNPCQDCKIFMVKHTQEVLLDQFKADFIATGEILGERPMSQYLGALKNIAKEGGAEVLRPLTAKNLPITIHEEKGLVNRDLLHDIKGRKRTPQFELAKKYDIKFPHPAGGCILCEKYYIPKLKDILDHTEIPNLLELQTLKGFRHFRKVGKIILGKNKDECERLKTLYDDLGYFFIVPETIGPSAAYESKEDEQFVKDLISAYSTKTNLEKFQKFQI